MVSMIRIVKINGFTGAMVGTRCRANVSIRARARVRVRVSLAGHNWSAESTNRPNRRCVVVTVMIIVVAAVVIVVIFDSSVVIVILLFPRTQRYFFGMLRQYLRQQLCSVVLQESR